MKTVVCIKQSVSGELNPFDACAYETALRIPDNEITLISMAPEKCGEFLSELTRLGAKEAWLLCDRAFAGADTLATSYTLSLAIKMLSPDLVICGRQTLDGDTAQVGPGLAQQLGYSLITNVMSVENVAQNSISCVRRGQASDTVSFPALITVERINELRLPRMRSKVGTLRILNANDILADAFRCGLAGSPTQVVKTFENDTEKRKCTFVKAEDIKNIIAEAKLKKAEEQKPQKSESKLANVWIIGEKPRKFAETVTENITVIEMTNAEDITEKIKAGDPDAVLWAADAQSKEVSARVAVMLETGLCADCTRLETDGKTLYMYRPAFSGNVIACIRCKTRPAMATVRTEEESESMIFAVGVGAADNAQRIAACAQDIGAGLAASRGAVDKDIMPYSYQVGLTGKTVNPDIYIAFGISGQVHHIVGMKNSKTVIAVNTDRKAPIFDFADFGIIDTAENVIKELEK